MKDCNNCKQEFSEIYVTACDDCYKYSNWESKELARNIPDDFGDKKDKMKDRSMEKKIKIIIIQATSFIATLIVLWIKEDFTFAYIEILFAISFWCFGYLYKSNEKTKYTFRNWQKIRKLNKQINKLEKVAETNLKGKGRDRKYCRPVYDARECLGVKQKELKELTK